MAKKVPLTKEAMTPDQRACFDLLCEVFRGEHHAPWPVYACGRGIEGSAYSGRMATYDHDELTRLVVLAHDQCIRVELRASGPGRVGLALWKRHKRDGCLSERHPTMEEAVARVRGAAEGVG